MFSTFPAVFLIAFLLVKFMSDAERKELEEEDILLKKMLDFYHEQRQDLSLTNEEWEAWLYGMQRLAERADDLKRRVIAAKCAEQH